MKFCVLNLIVLCSSYMVFEPAVGQHLLLLGGNIGEFYASMYGGLYTLAVIPPPAFLYFQCVFASFFVFFGFSCHYFFSAFVVRPYYSFSICYMFYLQFWETLFSKQRSVIVSEKDVGSVTSTYCSTVLFADFEQVIVCQRITLDY